MLDLDHLGLLTSHDVTLFDASQSPIATTNVPAGTVAPLDGGFRFAPITPIFLAPGTYSVIAYGTNSIGGAASDGYGDGGGLPSGDVNHAGFDPFQFTSDPSPAFPTGGDGGNHSSASFHYDLGNTAIPEPASLALLGGVALAGLARRSKR
jgi:hypothetical protein